MVNVTEYFAPPAINPELMYAVPSYVEPPTAVGAVGSLAGGAVCPGIGIEIEWTSAVGDVHVTVSPASTVIDDG